MKTKNACFWIFLLLSGSAYAQMSQKGTVQIFNSNKSPLPGVQLTATDAPAADNDADLYSLFMDFFDLCGIFRQSFFVNAVLFFPHQAFSAELQQNSFILCHIFLHLV